MEICTFNSWKDDNYLFEDGFRRKLRYLSAIFFINWKMTFQKYLSIERFCLFPLEKEKKIGVRIFNIDELIEIILQKTVFVENWEHRVAIYKYIS